MLVSAMKDVNVFHCAVYNATKPCTLKHPTVLHHSQALFLSWQELLPVAGVAEVGRAVDGLAGIGLSVSGAVVDEGPTAGIGLSLGAAVDGALVITVDVGVGVRGITGSVSVGTGSGYRSARHPGGVRPLRSVSESESYGLRGTQNFTHIRR